MKSDVLTTEAIKGCLMFVVEEEGVKFDDNARKFCSKIRGAQCYNRDAPD